VAARIRRQAERCHLGAGPRGSARSQAAAGRAAHAGARRRRAGRPARTRRDRFSDDRQQPAVVPPRRTEREAAVSELSRARAGLLSPHQDLSDHAHRGDPPRRLRARSVGGDELLQGAMPRQGPCTAPRQRNGFAESLIRLVAALDRRRTGDHRQGLVSVRHRGQPAVDRGAAAIFARTWIDAAPAQDRGIVCAEHNARHSAERGSAGVSRRLIAARERAICSFDDAQGRWVSSALATICYSRWPPHALLLGRRLCAVRKFLKIQGIATAAASLQGHNMALRYNLIDLIPKGDSGESNQDSEPSVTINPANPSQLIAGAFAATGSTYYKSTNGGVAWVRFGTLPSDDKSLAWKADGSAVLTVSMVDTTTPNTFSTYSSNTTNSNFGAAINVFSGSDLDQPWIATGPDDRVYVTYNDLNKSGADAGGSGNGETASILVSTDGGNDYTSVTLDRVGTTYQDDPSVRVAVNGNTVYGVFVRWNSSVDSDSNGDRYASQVVVVRSDNAGADGFTALGAGGNGVQIATPIDVFTDSGGSSLSVGEERIAAEVAITVDANDPNHVLVAYQDAPGADGSGQVQLVLAESTDG